jgi:hypothetical protein
MDRRTIVLGLSLAFVTGCATQSLGYRMPANDPTNPTAVEAPLPPPTAFVASVPGERADPAATTEPPMPGMGHDMAAETPEGMHK